MCITRSLRQPNTEGLIRVTVRKADSLIKMDTVTQNDPYAVVSIGGETFSTHRIDNVKNPEWNFVRDLPVESPARGQDLMVEIWDYDPASGDEFLGRASIKVRICVRISMLMLRINGVGLQAEVIREELVMKDKWLELKNVESGRVMVRIDSNVKMF